MKTTAFGSGLVALSIGVVLACSNTDGGSSVAGDAGAKANSGGNMATSSEVTSGGATSSTVSSGGAASTMSKGGQANSGGASSANAGQPGNGGTTSGSTTSTAIDCRQEGDGKTTLVFVNDCAQAVTYRGSDIAGGSLAPGAFACVDIGTSTETLSSKRYWGWIGADPGAGRYTLAEFTFNTDFYDLDWYDISHVDAHNLPMAILPSARPKCRQLSCPQDFLASCPAAGQYKDAAGTLVSCVSPNRDDPNNPVVLLFEQCDDAYAWSGDDQKGTDVSPMIGCEVEDFDIVFCPAAK